MDLTRASRHPTEPIGRSGSARLTPTLVIGDLGYHLRPEGDGERILPVAIIERFGRAADGTLVPITEGSTLPVVHRAAHAGVVRVQRWSFEL